MKFYWFGTSWVNGDELYNIVPREVHQNYAFPKLVSDYFNAECINLGKNGCGINSLPLAFSKLAGQFENDSIVFFCLPASYCISIFDESKQLKNIRPNGFKQFHNIHEYSEKWYRYFDTTDQRIYNYDTVINLLHFWCKSLKLKHYFLNEICGAAESIIDATDDVNWLVNKQHSLSEFILPIVNNRHVVFDDGPEIKEEEWNIQQEYIGKYVRPCYVHPNLLGHEKIAEELIKLLTNA